MPSESTRRPAKWYSTVHGSNGTRRLGTPKAAVSGKENEQKCGVTSTRVFNAAEMSLVSPDFKEKDKEKDMDTNRD